MSGFPAALDGVRVLDLTTGVAGPVAGMLLADLGAEVVKVHPPGGGASPERPGLSMWDRGKTAVVLDSPSGLPDLAAGADIILSPSVPEVVSSAVTIVMPPYLLDSTPWAGSGESGGLLFASLGHAWNQASYEDVPVDCVFPVSLYMQGIWAATTAIATLLARRAGRPTSPLVVIGGAHGAVMVAPGGFVAAHDEPHMHRPGGPGGALPNYRCYRCADGAWLFFGAFTTAFITRGLRALGIGAVLDDPRIDGDPDQVRLPENVGWLTRRLEAVFAQRSRPEWIQILEAADVPVAPVLATDDWLDHPQVTALGLRAEVGDVVMPGVLVGLSETPASVREAAATTHPSITTLIGHWSPRPVVADDRPPEPPLTGRRVLDLGTIIAGPYLATLLGELGADVIKVERPPSGDEFRIAHGGRGGVGFAVYNRDQRSIMLDLSDVDSRTTYLSLVRGADVVVDNYRPGVLARLGIGYADLAAVNPLVTTVSVSAFGSHGPLGSRPGFDPVVQALSGIMRTQGGPNEADSPTFLTVPINDVLAAALGALGACASLFARDTIGRGQEVTVTLCASASLLQSEQLVRVAGRRPGATGGRDHSGPHALARLYPAADGWVRLDGSPSGDLSILDVADPSALALLGVEEILARAAAAGVPAVRARKAAELVGDSLLIEHGVLAVTDTGVKPGRFLRAPGLFLSPPGDAPGPGQHSAEILAIFEEA